MPAGETDGLDYELASAAPSLPTREAIRSSAGDGGLPRFAIAGVANHCKTKDHHRPCRRFGNSAADESEGVRRAKIKCLGLVSHIEKSIERSECREISRCQDLQCPKRIERTVSVQTAGEDRTVHAGNIEAVAR